MTNAFLKRIRLTLGFFVVALALSGITAFPLQMELKMLSDICSRLELNDSSLGRWINLVHGGIVDTYTKYPFIAYGTDWLAFAHLILAVLFIGAIKDPVRNVWVIEFGLLACIAVVPLALICGSIRGIPFFWQIIDCSFGVLGFFPLWHSRNLTIALSRLIDSNHSASAI